MTSNDNQHSFIDLAKQIVCAFMKKYCVNPSELQNHETASSRLERGYLTLNSYQQIIRNAQNVIDQQFNHVRQSTNNAYRSVRLNLLIVVVVLSIATAIVQLDRSGEQLPIPIEGFNNLGLWIGFLFSFLSITFAIWVTHKSSMRAGLSEEDIVTILGGEFGERELLHELAASQSDWIKANSRTQYRDAKHLVTSHIFLFMAIGSYALAVFWAFYSDQMPYWGIYAGIGIVSFGFPFIVFLPYSRLEKYLANLWNQISSNFNWLFEDGLE